MKNKKCTMCAYFDPSLCNYVKSNGKVDKYGNVTKIDFDMVHNCQDFKLDLDKVSEISKTKMRK